MKVAHIMTKKPVAVKAHHTVKKILQILNEKKISGCPVVNSRGGVVGVVTQTDMLRMMDVYAGVQREDFFYRVLAAVKSDKYGDMKKPLKKMMSSKIKQFMKQAITIDADEDMYKAVRIMNKNDIDRLPVVRKGRLVGIISKQDIIRVMSEN